MPNVLKTCSKCKEVKTRSLFNKDKTTKDGYEYRCKECSKIKDKAYQQTELYRIKTRKHMWKKHGINITYAEYKIMLNEQDNKCAICEVHIDDAGWLCVDHNHVTKEVRKLLCQNCNLGLGHFKDNEEFLMKAVNYLRNSK